MGRVVISDEQLAGLLTIKTINSAHIPQVMRIQRLCQLDQWTLENLQAELQRHFTLARGLFLGRAMVGMSLSWLLPPECHLLKLMVHPELQGRGLGTRLMRDLIQKAVSAQATTFILEVRIGNIPAERLYKHLGFIGSGLRRNYYSDGSDAAIMTMELPLSLKKAQADPGRPNPQGSVQAGAGRPNPQGSVLADAGRPSPQGSVLADAGRPSPWPPRRKN
jgi:ribosomal-protein-alanine N-acetyltransferase